MNDNSIQVFSLFSTSRVLVVFRINLLIDEASDKLLSPTTCGDPTNLPDDLFTFLLTVLEASLVSHTFKGLKYKASLLCLYVVFLFSFIVRTFNDFFTIKIGVLVCYYFI